MDGVVQALAAIQSGAGPIQVLEALKSGASSNDGLNDIMNRLNSSTTNHIPDAAPVRKPSSLQRERAEHIYKNKTQSSDGI